MTQAPAAGDRLWESLPQRKWDLTTIGGLAMDLILPISSLPLEAGKHQHSAWTQWEAGGTGNTLIMGVRLGLKTSAIGALGDDVAGQLVADILETEGIDLQGTLFAPNQTTPLSVNVVAQNGEHVFAGGWTLSQPISFQSSWLTAMEEATVLFTTGYALTPDALEGAANTLTCMRHAQAHGGLICLDLGPEAYWSDLVAPAITTTDVLLATEEEICAWSQQADSMAAAQALLEAGPSLVVTKTGPRGCQIVSALERWECPGFNVEVVDTIGAGDSFAAGFIAALLQGQSLHDAGMMANAVGAAAVTHMGTGSLLPYKDEVEALLHRGPSGIRSG